VGLTVVGNIASKVSMVIDPSNPDALGYFQTSLAIIASLAGVALAWALGHAHQVVMLTGATVAGFVLLWTGTATALSFDDVDHGTARTTTVTDMALLRRVPPGALWLTSNTFLHFNRLAQQAVNGYRPDVVTIHQGFERHVQGGAPWRDTLSRRHPDLSKLAEAAVNAPLFPTSELTEESAQRAVFLEPTFALPVPVEQLHYVGGYFRLGATTRRPGQDTELQRVDEAQIRITAGPAIRDRREARTAHLILWLQLAVVRLQQGEARAAQSALEHIDALAPTNAYTSRLRPYVAELLEGETGAGDAAERIRSMDFSGLFQ